MTAKSTGKNSQTPSKKQFAAKKIGGNLIVTIDKERFSKKVSAEEAEIILKKVALYNKRPSDTAKKAIVKMLTPEATKLTEQKETIKAKAKGIKQQLKKQVKGSKVATSPERNLLTELEEMLTADATAVDKFQELLNRFKKVEAARPEAVASSAPRRGEH